MKKSISELLKLDIFTVDDVKASTEDFLFDRDTWTIRYIEADFGTVFNNKRVLIPRFLLPDSYTSGTRFYLDLRKEDIERCPKPEQHQPVSKKYEEEIHRYYNIDWYWQQPYNIPGDPIGSPLYPIRVPPPAVDEDTLDTRLRSFREVKGYNILAADGNLGHIEDMIVDDQNWKIVYVVVDTSNWLPWSKKVLLDIGWIEQISYQNKEATINLHSEVIRNAPSYDDSVPVEEQYENVLHGYYEQHHLVQR